MNTLSTLVCSSFLQKHLKEDSLSFLPPQKREALKKPPSTLQDLSLGFDLKDSILNLVHDSWISPFLRTLSKSDLLLFLSALPEKKADNLRKELLFTPSLIQVSTQAKSFLIRTMAKALISSFPHLLPIEALPSSQLNQLLELSLKDLYTLIDLLGLHDLSIEIKQIIDTTRLKQIHAILSQKQKAYLQHLTHQRERVLFKRLELHNWNGKPEPLLQLLRQRGLNRLAKALYPESPSLIWYLCHRMPSEEASLFSSLHNPLEHTKAHQFLARQVLDGLSFLQQITPPTPS